MSEKKKIIKKKGKFKNETLYFFQEDGISVTKIFEPNPKNQDKLIFKINFPELQNYFYYKEFTYNDIINSYPIFGIEENLKKINDLLTETMNSYGTKLLFNENQVYLVIKIKINSKEKEVKIKLDKIEYDTFQSLVEKVQNLLEERKKVCEIKSFGQIEKEIENNKNDAILSNLEILEKKYKKMDKTLALLKEGSLLSNSNIISDSEDIKTLLDLLKEIELENNNDENTKYQIDKNIVFRLVYRASRDGESSKDFHKRCDKIGPNITLVKTNKNIIFGGFTNNNWEVPKNEKEKKEGDDKDDDDNDKKNKNSIEEDGEEKSDPGAFCFSISNQKVYPHNNNKDGAIYCSRRNGPTFCGNIFSINNKMISEGGTCSKKKDSCFIGQNKDYEISGGEKKFKIKDVEVYEIVTIKNNNDI